MTGNLPAIIGFTFKTIDPGIEWNYLNQITSLAGFIMNLKFHLLVRITLVAIICLLTTTAFVFYRADLQSRQQSQLILESITKQLQVQLFRIDTGYARRDQFPDFSLWQETRSITGLCIHYDSIDNQLARSLCRGTEKPDKPWPQLFETVYSAMFNPGVELSRELIYKNQSHGSIRVLPSVEMELKRAWESLRALLELSVITVLSICFLVYLSISRALRPAQQIVAELEKIQKGDLTVRLPAFELLEWQGISTALNELTASQQQLLAERTKLTFKLISLQDDERRYLARELHDELGQCLAAINALSASIAQTAQQECPAIVLARHRAPQERFWDSMSQKSIRHAANHQAPAVLRPPRLCPKPCIVKAPTNDFTALREKILAALALTR